jgi:hypothetical protein
LIVFGIPLKPEQAWPEPDQHGQAKADAEKAREVMRANEHRIEMECER